MPVYCLDLEDGDTNTLGDVCDVLKSRGYPTNFFSSLMEGDSIDSWGNTRSVYISSEKPIDVATIDKIHDIWQVGGLRFGASEVYIANVMELCAELQPYSSWKFPINNPL